MSVGDVELEIQMFLLIISFDYFIFYMNLIQVQNQRLKVQKILDCTMYTMLSDMLHSTHADHPGLSLPTLHLGQQHKPCGNAFAGQFRLTWLL